MKCPKCDYLGFETGDRCKNCGYDFSLIEPSPVDEIDLTLHIAGEIATDVPGWLDEVDRALGSSGVGSPAAPAPELPHVDAPPVLLHPQPLPERPPTAATRAARVRADPTLPLFSLGTEDADDEPLIKLPATPRPPLAVRRTPESPRLRAVPKPSPRIRQEPELALQFGDEPPPSAETPAAPGREISAEAGRVPPSGPAVSGASARLAAAAVDHGLLLAIDGAVVYFTLRMAALPLGDWRMLPAAPLLAFLLLLKLSYFCAFTAVGGQTIGKMAARIRVVTDTGARVDGARAMRRTIAGALSALALGLGFIPALVGSDRRALHDRLARTRVVDLRSA